MFSGIKNNGARSTPHKTTANIFVYFPFVDWENIDIEFFCQKAIQTEYPDIQTAMKDQNLRSKNPLLFRLLTFLILPIVHETAEFSNVFQEVLTRFNAILIACFIR